MLKGYKTIIFNLIIAVLLVIRIFDPKAIVPSDTDVSTVLDQLDQVIVAVAAIGNIILRAITNTTLFQKTSPAPMPEVKPVVPKE